MLIHADTSDTLTLAGRMKRFRAPGPIIVRQPYGTRGERRNSISPISLSLHGFAEPGGVSARLSAARGIAELRHGVMGIGADRFPSFCIERTPPLSLCLSFLPRKEEDRRAREVGCLAGGIQMRLRSARLAPRNPDVFATHGRVAHNNAPRI